MRAVKTVQQHYAPSPEIVRMFDEFRQMMNACIQVGLAANWYEPLLSKSLQDIFP